MRGVAPRGGGSGYPFHQARALALPDYRPRHNNKGGRHTREPAKVHRYQRGNVNINDKQGARAPSSWGAENPRTARFYGPRRSFVLLV